VYLSFLNSWGERSPSGSKSKTGVYISREWGRKVFLKIFFFLEEKFEECKSEETLSFRS
jgi:hypothetical protein